MGYLHEISGLKEEEEWLWPESDYGRAYIKKVDGKYEILEIPMYGGVPRYSETVCTPEEVIEIVSKWT